MKEKISATALYIEFGISLSISIFDKSSTKSSSFWIGILLSLAILIIFEAVTPCPFAVIRGALSFLNHIVRLRLFE